MMATFQEAAEAAEKGQRVYHPYTSQPITWDKSLGFIWGVGWQVPYNEDTRDGWTIEEPHGPACARCGKEITPELGRQPHPPDGAWWHDKCWLRTVKEIEDLYGELAIKRLMGEKGALPACPDCGNPMKRVDISTHNCCQFLLQCYCRSRL